MLETKEERKSEVTITQDDHYLNEASRGSDILLAPDGRSYVIVDEPKSYSLVKNREYGEHVLRLVTSKDGLSLYSLMFISSAIPELISNN